jgi:hypothetical protein
LGEAQVHKRHKHHHHNNNHAPKVKQRQPSRPAFLEALLDMKSNPDLRSQKERMKQRAAEAQKRHTDQTEEDSNEDWTGTVVISSKSDDSLNYNDDFPTGTVVINLHDDNADAQSETGSVISATDTYGKSRSGTGFITHEDLEHLKPDDETQDTPSKLHGPDRFDMTVDVAGPSDIAYPMESRLLNASHPDGTSSDEDSKRDKLPLMGARSPEDFSFCPCTII